MKVIFLDIDGVLNAEEDFFQPDGSKNKNAPYIDRCIFGISQPRVARLKKIVDETGARIVLTSSWKDAYMLVGPETPEMALRIRKYLRNALGRKHLKIFDTTRMFEVHGLSFRGYGAKAWLKKWNSTSSDPVTEYVFLDDEKFDYEEEGLIQRVVLTDFYSRPGGLTDEKAEEAIKILKGEKHET